MKETDLIYEGIATLPPAFDNIIIANKETDLIYEGIATTMTTFECWLKVGKKLT